MLYPFRLIIQNILTKQTAQYSILSSYNMLSYGTSRARYNPARARAALESMSLRDIPTTCECQSVWSTCGARCCIACPTVIASPDQRSGYSDGVASWAAHTHSGGTGVACENVVSSTPWRGSFSTRQLTSNHLQYNSLRLFTTFQCHITTVHSAVT